MLGPAMGVEIKNRLADISPTLKIALGGDYLIGLGRRQSNYFPGRRNDAAAAHMVDALLNSSLGTSQYPGAVLIGACLHR